MGFRMQQMHLIILAPTKVEASTLSRFFSPNPPRPRHLSFWSSRHCHSSPPNRTPHSPQILHLNPRAQNPNLFSKLPQPLLSRARSAPATPRPLTFPLLRPPTTSPPMASASVAAEYAKSARSSCKKCGKPIAAGVLRVGLVSKDPRGFDVTKWHHLECFPRKSATRFGSAEEIKGFSSLKECDQEALKKLKEECASDQTPLKKVKKAVDKGVVVSEEPSAKKPKLSGAGTDQKIVFSSSDIKTKYKDATLAPKWKAFQTVIFREKDDGLRDSSKIAAFDFDGCLVNTSVKRIGPDAWSLLYPSIPEKLRSLYNDGYKLVIFTNEANIERWKNKRQEAVDSKIGRVDNFLKLVKVPMQVFIACGIAKSKSGTGPDDPFRKPNTGMWKIMKEHFNSGIDIDMDQSFYVGDAAGRANDHSDTDIKFAEEIGLKFYVPEEFFEA